MSKNHRPYLRSTTKEMVNQNAQKTQVNEHGQLVDPNNGQILDENAQYGHVTGMENRGFVNYSNQAGMAQSELNDITNNAGLYQLESPEGNMGHRGEESDANETALNTANYCYLENSQYQKTTYINPPSVDGESWTLTVENTQTGVESQVGTFNPDLGETIPESQATIHSARSSYSSDSISYCDTDTAFVGKNHRSGGQVVNYDNVEYIGNLSVAESSEVMFSEYMGSLENNNEESLSEFEYSGSIDVCISVDDISSGEEDSISMD